MSNLILSKSNTSNNNFQDDNGILETGTGEILSDKRPNGEEKPWKKHKINSLKLHGLYEKALIKDNYLITENRMQSLEHCGNNLLFSVNDKNEKKFKSAYFCRLRTCPMCNWRKSLKMFGQTNKIANKILEQNSSTRFLFVTFTVENCSAEKLEETISFMNQGFKRLTDKSKKLAITNKFKSNMLGYIRAMEVTYNQEKDTYHPHIHCIFALKAQYFTKGYIKKSDWQYIWGECCKTEYEPIVHVQTIKNSTSKAVAEVAKYPVKMDELANYQNENKAIKALIVFTKILKGRRLITFGGVFAEARKLLNLDDIDTGDLVNLDDDQKEKFEEIKKVLFMYNVKVGCYIAKN
jgi:plasmid rolling circle replication initiator protein Rep